jgi:hypothetical protein
VAGSDGDAEQLSTEELRAIQAEREDTERTMAEGAHDPLEERTHERRAERAAYLREKLDEQADSERE